MDTATLTPLLPWLIAFILTADKLVAAVVSLLRRAGKLPREITDGLDGFAAYRVAEQQRQARYQLLTDKADQILAELTPNGGKSLRDLATRVELKVSAIEHKLDVHLAEAGPLTEELYALRRTVDAHLSLHLNGHP